MILDIHEAARLYVEDAWDCGSGDPLSLEACALTFGLEPSTELFDELVRAVEKQWRCRSCSGDGKWQEITYRDESGVYGPSGPCGDCGGTGRENDEPRVVRGLEVVVGETANDASKGAA